MILPLKEEQKVLAHVVCNFFSLVKKMLRKDFLKFESTSELHKELTNILLIAINESAYFYCYCNERKKCDLYDLCDYLYGNENLVKVYHQKNFYN